MNYSEWKPYYRMIANDFHFNESMDKKSSTILSSILGKNFLQEEEISRIINGKEVLVLGDSPYFSFNVSMARNRVLITADDATRHSLRNNTAPAIVITDLDADEEILLQASSMGAVMGVHAHGDNMERLNMVEKFSSRFGTTQTEPLWNVYDFGGFTDGDRAVFLAHHFGARKIILAGFNFYEPNRSKGKDFNRKMKKLTYSAMLIRILRDKYNANIIFI